MIHSQFLKQVTIALNATGKGDPVFFNHLLYQTTNLAIALWKGPLFDPISVGHFHADYWAPLIQYGQTVMEIQKRMNWFTQNVRRQRLLADTAVLFTCTEACLAGTFSIPPENYCALNVRAEYLQIRLLNLVHDQERNIRLHTAPPFLAAMNGNMCLALTAVLSIRSQKHEPMIDGPLVSNISLVILGKFRAAYVHVDSSMTPIEKAQFANASLWVAFIAVLVEERFSENFHYLIPSGRW